MKEKQIKELFLEKGKNRCKKRLNVVSYEEYKDIIFRAIYQINPDSSEKFFKEKYKLYCNIFDKKFDYRNTSKLGFYSTTTTNIQYYLSRGWNKDEAECLLKKRQSVSKSKFIKKYGKDLGNKKYNEYLQKRATSYSDNYKNGNHKKFYRPSQKEYWETQGFKNHEIKEKIFDYYSKLGKKFHNKRKEEGIEFLTIRQLKYWINKGLSLDSAQEQLRKIQDKRSLKYFIEKYGEKEGTRRFHKTIKKWLKILDSKTFEEKLDILIRKTKRSKKYSTSSICLFEKTLKELKEKYNISFKKIYYKEKEWYIYDHKNKKIYFYDLMIKDINLIIEYNGLLFHPNKNILSEKEWISWINPITKKDANYHYKYDLQKQKIAEQKKYHYLIVWENETFDNNKNKIINKILSLYENRIN
jgi:hypothetical protein